LRLGQRWQLVQLRQRRWLQRRRRRQQQKRNRLHRKQKLQRQKPQELVLEQPRLVRASQRRALEQRLLLFYRRQPGQQQQQQLPKRVTCSFLTILDELRKQFPEIVKRKPKPKFKLCSDWGKDSSSFYPALNYMPDKQPMKTLSKRKTA
jgi:hypothetical protein